MHAVNKTDITFWLSIAGSSLGVILAVIKLYEFISGLRPRYRAISTRYWG